MSTTIDSGKIELSDVSEHSENVIVADKEYQLAEYSRLCSEVEKRIELALQFFDRLLTVTERSVTLAGVALTLAGLVLSVGSHVVGSAMGLILALLCYAAAIAFLYCPILLSFLAGLVGENDLRIGQINYHIKREHEPQHLPHGWETIRHQLFRAMPWVVRPADRAQYHALASRKGLKLLSMRGLFAVVQLLFIAAAIGVGTLGTLQLPNAWQFPMILLPAFVGLLTMIAAILTVVTWHTIEHRRDRGDAASSV
jgi:hypothetical protein